MDGRFRLEDYGTAMSYYRQAIELFREYSDLHSEAHVLHRLGNALDLHGEHDAAVEAWARAAGLFTELDHPDAEELWARRFAWVYGDGVVGDSRSSFALSERDRMCVNRMELR